MSSGLPLNMRVIRAAGSTVAATVTYVTPLWSTLFGVVLLAGPVGWNKIAGGALVIAGVVFARSAGRQPMSTTARPTISPRSRES